MSSWLPETSNDLRVLTRYLVDLKGLPESTLKVTCQYDRKWDTENRRDPRAFCYVTAAEWRIYCARAIEGLPREFRWGVLLHELGHLLVPAFSGDESEVDADMWVLKQVPEAGFHYDSVQYSRIQTGRDEYGCELVLGKHLQCVAPEFVERVLAVTQE